MGRLEDTVVLVAGAGGAQGRAITARLSEEGAAVVAADIRTDNLPDAGDLSGRNGARVVPVELDVTDAGSWASAVSTTERVFGGLHGLVDAAAVLSRAGVELTRRETWHLVHEVNIIGAWAGLRASLPAMRRAGRGSAVLISSIDGIVGRGTATAYHASKGAVRQIVRTAAVELAPEGIRVNAVCPGAMTDRMAMVVDQGDAPGDFSERTPLPRFGVPDDIAWAVVYLISDEASFITGIDLVVDGGYTAM